MDSVSQEFQLIYVLLLDVQQNIHVLTDNVYGTFLQTNAWTFNVEKDKHVEMGSVLEILNSMILAH